MHIPTATYRLQFNPRFTFQDARIILDYLSSLGISDLYASPIFKARRGSTHGYDIVNPLELNPELGTPADFRALCEGLKERGLFWLQDIVPNHMAFDSENTILMDLLQNGSHSPYQGFFDIDWEHYYESLRGRLLAPFLGSFYAEALLEKEIQLSFDAKRMFITYYGNSFPLKIESYVVIFTKVLERIAARGGQQTAEVTQFLGALELFKSALQTGNAHSRSQQVAHASEMIGALYAQDDSIRSAMDETIEAFNGIKGDAGSFDSLDALIQEQLFRFSFWKVAAEEINYRRFFTVNELISVKVEDRSVFSYTHDFIVRLVREGLINGLRIDHIDGLYDPAQYLRRLRQAAGGVYTVVEKILGADERIPDSWEVEGTTGYDFMSRANALFCDQKGERGITRAYVKFTGLFMDYETLISDKKRLILGKHLAGAIDNLAHELKRISASDRYGRDTTLYGLRRALVEVMASFPVYRSYVSPNGVRQEDARWISEAFARARKTAPSLAFDLDYIEKFLLLRCPHGASQEEQEAWVGFAMKFQQYTAALMAKGFEDTILYVYNRLLSLNEVGSDPYQFGITADDFHAFNLQKAARDDRSLNATSTHDVKRGEDVRSRISVLSEIPQEWEAFLKTAAKLNRSHKARRGLLAMPDENDEYALYQTLLGSFPFEQQDLDGYLQRMEEYVIKAVREAKVHTAWIRPDSEYEGACVSFLRALFDPQEANRFLPEFRRFQKRIAFYGVLNSLSQLTLKAASVGIPDLYQGCELWDLWLVDPDNRRPVDFSKRMRMLKEFQERAGGHDAGFFRELSAHPQDGRIKLFFTWRLLAARRSFGELFQRGCYIPLKAEGPCADNLIAFAREHAGVWSICCAGRFFTRLVKEGEFAVGQGVWGDTRIILPPQAPVSWYDEVSAQELDSSAGLEVGVVFSSFPCALLTAQSLKE